MNTKAFCIIAFMVTSVPMMMAQSAKSLDVVNRFYEGWKELSTLKDHSTGDAQNVECNINECTQGGDNCEEKSQVSAPREIDFLTGNHIKGSITIGPYISGFERFVENEKVKFTYQQPREIGAIKGADDMPTYKCFTVSKTYTWGNGKSKQLTDTLWVKAGINRISGIRNEFGGSRQVSSANLSNVNELNSFSITDLEIQASTYYDKKDYESALKLYRQISLRDWSNSDANFFAMLMEGKDKGCKSMSKKYYQREAAWWFIKNSRNEYFTNSLSSYAVDKKILQFEELGMPYLGESLPPVDIYRTMKPMACGLMVSCDSKGKYGFINEEGKTVIGYQYDKAYTFDENGLALVRKNGKFGYINTTGQVVISIMFDNAQPFFYNDRAYCIDNGVLKLLNSKGSIQKIINSQKQYHIYEYFRTKEYVMFYYVDQSDNSHKWDIYDYNGNLYIEGCTAMSVQTIPGVIQMKKNDAVVISLDYKW